MKHFLLPLLRTSALTVLVAFAGVSGAQQSSSDEDTHAAMLRAAKDAGAEAVSANQSTRVDSEGRPVDSEGRPVSESGNAAATQGNSESAQQDNLRYFQNLTGTEGVTLQSSPGEAGQTGRATIATRNSFQFNCRLARPGSVYSAGDVGFRFESCTFASGSSGAVVHANFRMCDKARRADICASPADFAMPVRLSNGAYVPTGIGEVGLGCNDTAQCQVTYSSSTTLGGNDTSLREDAQAREADSELVRNWRTTGREDCSTLTNEAERERCNQYQRERQAEQSRLSTFQREQGASVNAGIQEGAPSSNCSDVRQCLREAESVQRFNRTCERAFPLTQQRIRTQYNAVRSCDVVESSDPAVPSSNSCSASDLAGYTRVGAEPAECTPSREECTVRTYTEFWVDMAQRVVSAPTYAPSLPPNGAASCDSRLDSGSRMHSCSAWFGRTADNSACVARFRDESGASVQGEGAAVDYAQVAGCGFCTDQVESRTCYGTPSEGSVLSVDQAEDTCAATDLNGCALVSAEPLRFTSEGGLVVAQREVYACQKSSTQCVEWSDTGTAGSCTSQELAQGTDSLASYRSTGGESLTNALVAAAQLDSIAAGQEGGSTVDRPGIYNGRDLRCRRPVGEVDERFTPNCCASDLQRPPEGATSSDACTMQEAELAAARRSGYTHFVGQYCSRLLDGSPSASEDTSVNAGERCIRQTQTYCVFDSVLARLVHEQGRPQLNALAASGANAQVERAGLSFSYLDPLPEGTGRWSSIVSANGVQVAAYQWPSYCATTEGAMKARAHTPDAPDCPPLVATWFASCEMPGGCDPLPRDPWGFQDNGNSNVKQSRHWKMSSVDPLKRQTHALSTLAVVTGACSPTTNACSYELSAWPAGQAGRATVTRDLQWPFLSTQQGARPGAAPSTNTGSAVGDMMFRGYSAPAAVGGAVPESVRLELSRDGGATWTSYVVPTNQPGREHALGSTGITVMGHCDSASNLCKFRAVGTVDAQAKPWGTAINPDCSGFTAGQLTALDFSKMDLDEWTSSVLRENGREVNTAALRESAPQQAEQARDRYEAGRVENSSPTSGNFARMVPAEGFGPFQAKLQVSGFWPEVTGDPARDTNRVTAVTVDWGDCSEPQSIPVSSYGVGFEATHLYRAPNHMSGGAYVHACLGGSMERNLTHRVRLTVQTTQSGTRTSTLSVVNVWSRFPGAQDNNALENETLSSRPHGR